MELKELFKKLVTIDSPSNCEGEMVKYIQNWAKSQDFSYFTDNLGNTLIQVQGEGKPIMFCAHMDTVEPGRNIIPIEKDGVIKSASDTILGADNKSTVAAIMHSVENYVKANNTNKRALELLFTVKEETGGGVENFDFSKISSEEAFLFDFAKPLGGIILGSPFIINFEIEITGKAAHSSKPSEGINSVIPSVSALKELKIGQVDDLTTLNIGRIDSGTGVNTVPKKTFISGEIRSYKENRLNQLLNTLENSFREKCEEYDCELDFSTNGFASGYIHEKGSLVINKLTKILKQSLGNVKYFEKSAISDANVLNTKGIIAVNMSDGVKFPHSTNEHIKVEDLEKLSDIISEIIKQY